MSELAEAVFVLEVPVFPAAFDRRINRDSQYLGGAVAFGVGVAGLQSSLHLGKVPSPPQVRRRQNPIMFNGKCEMV